MQPPDKPLPVYPSKIAGSSQAADLAAERFAEADRLAWQFGLTYLSAEGLHKLADLIAHVRASVPRGLLWG